MSNFIPLREAMKALGVSHNTLRRYADKGEIPTIRLKSGHRRFDVGSFVGQQSKPSIVCYCRVSSTKQKDDLARQVVFMRERYPQAEIITDIGSGLNFKRKGLRTLLGRFLQGDKLTLVVAHRDRLVRFGFELFQYLCQQNGGELLVLDSSEHSPETELTQDLLAILHVFSCRMHGLRKYSTKIKEDSDIPKRRASKSV